MKKRAVELPKIGETINPRPHSDILGIIKNVYSEDSMLAVLREFISNSFQHGKTSIVNVDYNGTQLTISDNGVGVGVGKEKYFFLQDFGESGQTFMHFNRWRVGITSSIEVADKIMFHVKSSSQEFKIEINIEHGGFDAKVKRLPIEKSREHTGVTATFYLNGDAQRDSSNKKIEDTLKLICYWWIMHMDKQVYFNGKRIEYNFREGKDVLVCKNVVRIKDLESTANHPIQGDVYYKLLSYPSWFPPKNYLVLYVEGNFVTSERLFWGGFNSIVFANTVDPTIMTKLNAGKTSIKNFKNTGFYKAIMKYSLQYKEEESSTPKTEVLHKIIKELLVLADTRGFGFKNRNSLNKIVKNVKKETMRKKLQKVGSKEPPTFKGEVQVEQINDPNEPFISVDFSGGAKTIMINSAEGDEGVYPTLSNKVNVIIDNPTSKNIEFLIPFISRVSDVIANSVEFEKYKEVFDEKWKREDHKTEVALSKKNISDHTTFSNVNKCVNSEGCVGDVENKKMPHVNSKRTVKNIRRKRNMKYGNVKERNGLFPKTLSHLKLFNDMEVERVE